MKEQDALALNTLRMAATAEAAGIERDAIVKALLIALAVLISEADDPEPLRQLATWAVATDGGSIQCH